jgi:hypothetical protein
MRIWDLIRYALTSCMAAALTQSALSDQVSAVYAYVPRTEIQRYFDMASRYVLADAIERSPSLRSSVCW